MRVVTDEVQFHGNEEDGKGRVLSLDFQPSSPGALQRLATCGSDKTVRIWRWSPRPAGQAGKSVELLAELEFHDATVNVVRWSPDGQLLASGSDDGKVALWGPRPGSEEAWKVEKRLGAHSEVFDVAWTPDGKLVFCATFMNLTIGFSADTGKMVERLDGHQLRVQGIAADPLGRFLATVAADKTLRVYSRKKAAATARWQIHHAVRGEAKQKDKEEKDEEEPGPEPRLLGEIHYHAFYRRLGWSPDGAVLAVPSGGLSHDPAFGTLLLHRQDLSVFSGVIPASSPTVAVRFAPKLEAASAGWVAAGRSRFAVAAYDGSVCVYDTATRDPVGYAAGMHHASFTDLAWSPDARCLAASSNDGFVSFLLFDAEEVPAVVPRTPLKAAGPAKEDASPKKEERNSPKRTAVAPAQRTPLKARTEADPGSPASSEDKQKKRRIEVTVVEAAPEAEPVEAAEPAEVAVEPLEGKRRRIAPEVVSLPPGGGTTSA